MKNKFKILQNIVISFVILITANNIFASSTAIMAVSATILPSCTIIVAPLTFGTYTSTTDLEVNTNIILTCTPGSTYKVGLDAGISPGATVTNRKMVGTISASNTLSYGLYTDAGYQNNWGNSSPNWATGTSTSGRTILTVYGKIPAGQTSAVDTYSDKVTATVTSP